MDTKSNGDDTRGLTWAIVDSGTRRLVGMVPDTPIYPGDSILVREAVELETSVTRLPGQNGQPVSIIAPTMIPVDVEEDPVDIFVLVHNIRFFKNMKDQGRQYEMIREQLMNQLTQLKARRAGIEIIQSIPRNPSGLGGGSLG